MLKNIPVGIPPGMTPPGGLGRTRAGVIGLCCLWNQNARMRRRWLVSWREVASPVTEWVLRDEWFAARKYTLSKMLMR